MEYECGVDFADHVPWGTNGAIEGYLDALAQLVARHFGAGDRLVGALREEREGFFTGKVVFLAWYRPRWAWPASSGKLGGEGCVSVEPLEETRSGNPRMDFESVLTAVRSWPAAERLRLIEEVWDDLPEEDHAAALTEDMKAVLDRRLEALEKNPDAVVPWEVVEARALERFRK